MKSKLNSVAPAVLTAGGKLKEYAFSISLEYLSPNENIFLPPDDRDWETVFNLDFTGEGSDYDKNDAATYTDKIFSSADNQFFTTKNLGILSEQIAALGGLAFPYLEQKSVEQATDFGTLSNAMNTVLEEIEQGNINNPLTGGMWQDLLT